MLILALALGLGLTPLTGQVGVTSPIPADKLVDDRVAPDVSFDLVRLTGSGEVSGNVYNQPAPCPPTEPPSVQVWVLKTDGTALRPDRAPSPFAYHVIDQPECTIRWFVTFPSAPRADLVGAVLKIGDRMFVTPFAPAGKSN